MSKKVYFPVILLVLSAMLLGACAPAAQPTEAPIVEAPVATQVPATAVPTAEPVVEAPDFVALFDEVIANNPQDKGYGSIGADKLNTDLVENPELFLLDIREPAEFEADGYIASENFAAIPLRQLMDNLDKLPTLDAPIVVYCKSGHRGALAMTALQLVGYTNVRNLGGGIGSWKKAEFPVEMAAAPAPETISTPIVENEALFTAVHDYMAAIPDSFYATSPAKVNESMVNAETMIIVDVRTAEEFGKGYIDGAENIPMDQFMGAMDQLTDKDAKIVIYCGSGHRGAIVLMGLMMNGYTNVVNIGGGFGAWKTAELPFVGGAPDFANLYAGLVADNGKELGYGTVAADVLNTELVENADLFVLDIREPAEFEADGYIQTTNYAAIPLRQLFDNLDKLPSVDTPMVVYCKSGHRGAFAWAALKLMGYDVRNLAGGIGAWKKAEFPVEMAAAPVAETISTPIVANEALFTALHDYLAAISDDFYATSAANVNEMIINAETFALLDVRRADEFAEGYIETAINIPLEDLMPNLAQLPDKDAKIVIYCKSGHRGGVAVQALRQLGYTNVINLGGGMNAWVAAELPTVK
jgi:rhodanese-related sulfurtransferase